MKLLWRWLLFPSLVIEAMTLAIDRRGSEFQIVRTKMQKDLSGRGGDPNGKYFHESVFHPHYDGRFADRQLGYQERRHTLSNLIQTYLATTADLGVETWLMHGTLLGWWWNRKILPWDSDSDVQMSESSMHYLASYYNMSIFHYRTPRIPEGRDYLLEINPHYINREQTDKLNVIDARWIDTESGLFIDITTARYNTTHPAGAGMLSCKDGHEYRDTYIFPLRDTYFEGAPAKIPFAYKELLESEYRQRALTMTEFEGHHFDDVKREWIPTKKQVNPPPKPEEKKLEPNKQEPSKQEPNKQQPNKQELSKQEPKAAEAKKPTEPQKDDTPVKPGSEVKPNSPEASPKAKPIEKPLAQVKAEDKIAMAEAKRSAILKMAEEKRRAAEQKAIDKRLEKLEKERIRDEKAAARKAKLEAKATQATT